AEHADQGFQLVGQRQTDPDQVARQCIASKTRLVMVLYGKRDALVQAFVLGVIAPHDPLQLWKLSYHVSQQISLGQTGCLVSLSSQLAALQMRPNRARQGAYILDAQPLRTQLMMIDHLVQAR